jgi:hypothetical protein
MRPIRIPKTLAALHKNSNLGHPAIVERASSLIFENSDATSPAYQQLMKLLDGLPELPEEMEAHADE